METTLRPFATVDVGPVPFTKPGAVAAPLIHIIVGAVGGTTTFNYSLSNTASFKLGKVHKKAPGNGDHVTMIQPGQAPVGVADGTGGALGIGGGGGDSGP